MAVAHDRGQYATRNYTPTSDVNAGSVVVLGGIAMVANADIAANTLGELGVPGDVAYYVDMDDAVAVADGAAVNIDVASATIMAAATQHFGYSET